MQPTGLDGTRVFNFSKLNEIMCFASDETQQHIRSEVINMLTQIQSQQLLEIKCRHLHAGDLVLDLHKKSLHEVDYTSHYDSTMNDGASNTIMVCYIGEDDAENFDINSDVTILIDKAELVKRKLDDDLLKEVL